MIDQRAANVVPALIADLGDEAAWRYVEFFTANIRNPHTRRAYARACGRYFGWCERRGLMPAVQGGPNSGHAAEEKPATAAVTGSERVPLKSYTRQAFRAF